MDFKIRQDRRWQGSQTLVREREEYFRLMDQGVSSREACRIVGIDRRTGLRWRNGYTRSDNSKWTPPVNLAIPDPGPSRHLRESERVHIADRLRENASLRTIAAELGRSPSTISREIRRNGALWRGKGWVYRPLAAQSRADARRPRPKPGQIGQNSELRDFIQHHLERRWSPEQICQVLRARFPSRPEMHVTHETVYQALYARGRGELRRELTIALRTGRTMRRPHRQSYRRRPRMSNDMVMISERPAEAADRAIPGHWEGDLIIGKAHKSAIGTLVERSSRFVALVHLPNGRQPVHVRDALIQTASTLPAQLRRSLTWDQGSEMALHKQFSTATDIPVFFCHPGSPWQRGSNENTNGLLRQYFPKGTDLSRHSREQLDAVAAELNNRPRKTLGVEDAGSAHGRVTHSGS